ncbi:MAG: saccharopine dehydrogenase C-terminal domain-containing protein [Planctomycetota bacterium]
MRVLVLGAGMMGSAAACDLARARGVTRVYVGDVNLRRAENAAAMAHTDNIEPLCLDVADHSSLVRAMKMAGTTLAAVSYKVNLQLTHAALEAGSHLCDLGGNNTVVREQLKLTLRARAKGVTIIPDCGLAPGLACLMAARGLAQIGGQAESLEIRVGGLPQHPRPPLNYKLVFAPSGLINEYVEPCLVVRDGKTVTVEPMTELEAVEFPAPFGTLEAFHTSGGLSTLPESFAGRITNMQYKTLRYPGHCERMKAMLDLGLKSDQLIDLPSGQRVRPREVFERVLEQSLVNDDQDAVLVRVSLLHQGRTHVQEIIDKQDAKSGHTAMMRTTAYPAAVIAWLMASGAIRERGVLPQEQCVPLDGFFQEIEKRGIEIVSSATSPKGKPTER